MKLNMDHKSGCIVTTNPYSLRKSLTSRRRGNACVCSQRSLPALRQMTPDSEAFIQQSLLPQTSTPAAAASTALAAVVLRPPLSTVATTSTSTSAALTKTTVISLAQSPHSKTTLVIQPDDCFSTSLRLFLIDLLCLLSPGSAGAPAKGDGDEAPDDVSPASRDDPPRTHSQPHHCRPASDRFGLSIHSFTDALKVV